MGRKGLRVHSKRGLSKVRRWKGASSEESTLVSLEAMNHGTGGYEHSENTEAIVLLSLASYVCRWPSSVGVFWTHKIEGTGDE